MVQWRPVPSLLSHWGGKSQSNYAWESTRQYASNICHTSLKCPRALIHSHVKDSIMKKQCTKQTCLGMQRCSRQGYLCEDHSEHAEPCDLHIWPPGCLHLALSLSTLALSRQCYTCPPFSWQPCLSQGSGGRGFPPCPGFNTPPKLFAFTACLAYLRSTETPSVGLCPSGAPSVLPASTPLPRLCLPWWEPLIHPLIQIYSLKPKSQSCLTSTAPSLHPPPSPTSSTAGILFSCLRVLIAFYLLLFYGSITWCIWAILCQRSPDRHFLRLGIPPDSPL